MKLTETEFREFLGQSDYILGEMYAHALDDLPDGDLDAELRRVSRRWRDSVNLAYRQATHTGEFVSRASDSNAYSFLDEPLIEFEVVAPHFDDPLGMMPGIFQAALNRIIADILAMRI